MRYEDVADNVGLDASTRGRYIRYMRIRWVDTEELRCRNGYAAEWAWRFKDKGEYGMSDSVGLVVLKEIDGTTEKREVG